jgi:hypothetical protein
VLSFSKFPLENQPKIMEAIQNLPEHQKQEFIRHIEEGQVRDSLKMYNQLVEQCFDKCVLTGWGGVSSFHQNLVGCMNNCLFPSGIQH